MAAISFDELEDAFEFVSFSGPGENQAVLCRETGKLFFQAEYIELDTPDPFPEDIDDNPAYIAIPDKTELGLGRRVAVDFAASHLEDPHVVSLIFNGPGAYGRWKVLLEERGLLHDWFTFELAEARTALRQWCEVNEIELERQAVPR